MCRASRPGWLDVVAEDSGPSASNLAAPRIRADGPQGLADEVTVCSSLIFAPPISRVLEDINDVALRTWRAEYTCHRRVLRIETELVGNFSHQVIGRRLDAESRVELRNALVERVL